MYKMLQILKEERINCVPFRSGKYEFDGGKERALATANGVEEEGDAGATLQRQHTRQPIEIRQTGGLHTVPGAARLEREQDLQLHRIPQDRAHQQSAQLGTGVRYEGTEAGSGNSEWVLSKVSGWSDESVAV